MDNALAFGDYTEAALMAERKLGLKPGNGPEDRQPVEYKPKHVLSHLEAAEAWRMAGDFDRSIEHYDAAESALGDASENVTGSFMGKVGASLINETLTTYIPSPAESILINYYKALTFWSRHQSDLARVELNRADDRTRMAVERYTKEIEKALKEAEEKKSDQAYNNPEVSEKIDAHFPEIAQWQPYAEFIVPPATYLQALYLGASDVPADKEKSHELYERLIGIVGEHETLQFDFSDLQKGSLCPTNDCIWILVERSQGPELQERKFSYPIYNGQGIINVGMALPALAPRFDPVMKNCRIEHGDSIFDCEQFASMERVIQTEFKKRFPGIATRAVVSTVAKALAQDMITRRAGFLGSIGSAVLFDQITTADIRMWRSMPGDFTLNRIRKNGGSEVAVSIGGKDVSVPLSEHAGSMLIHIKAMFPHLEPSVTLVPL